MPPLIVGFGLGFFVALSVLAGFGLMGFGGALADSTLEQR
jgi:hypothetical protein